MRKIALAAVAALSAGFAVDAFAAKAKPQKFTCKPNKGGAFVDKAHKGRSAAPLCLFTPIANTIQLSLAGNQPAGRGVKSILLVGIGWPDIRTAELPITLDNSGSNGTVTGSYSVTKLRGFTPVITSWAVDEDGAQPFQITITKFDPNTSRVTGTFSGKMLPGDNSPDAGILDIKNGVIQGTATFTGL